MRWQGFLGALIGCVVLAGGAAAAGIDCTKARDAIDRAICASPALLAQDSALGDAFAAALGRDPGHADALRESQRRWLRDRRAACLKPSSLTACLGQQFAARLALLAPPIPVPAAPVAPAAPAALVETKPDLIQATAPNGPLEDAAATLDADHLPAASPGETLLHVTRPGRFAIATRSVSGSALELVDMITGPTPREGSPGAADGRLDLLLDAGIYKLRVVPAEGASGDVALQVTPSHEIAAPVAVPQQGRIDGELADFQQRSFWLAVGDDQSVWLEAAGRSLADMRLWRDGVDLVPLPPQVKTIEPMPGHPLTDIVLSGHLPPGTYRVTAYGGPAQVWADGQAAQPFHLRGAPSDALIAGWVHGRIGPFGSEWYRSARHDDLFQLDMAAPGALRAGAAQAAIAPNSRVASVTVRARAGSAVQVQGPEGTPFQLRARLLGDVHGLNRPGLYWLTANTTGLGGDDVPATLMLARVAKDRFEMVGAQAPDVGPGAWRRRFNLAGPVSLVFHAGGGPVRAVITDVPMPALALHALDSGTPVRPRSDADPGAWDIPAGWYVLLMTPRPNEAGIADVTLGPPGTVARMAPPQPTAPSFSFGQQRVGRDETLVLFSNVAPGAAMALDARPSPVDLAEAPLRLQQQAGQALDIAVKAPATGRLMGLEIGVGPVELPQPDQGMVHVPPPDHPRLLALSWQPPQDPMPIPPPVPEADRQAIGPGRFFDLKQGEERSFALDVAQGGLVRVETLGRLATSGSIGTHFLPRLQSGNANGVGQNMQLQTWLRAGRYHVEVKAEAGSGHLGIAATPAPLQTAAALLPGGVLRLGLPAGGGAVVPLTIATAGRYRLELMGQGRVFEARLEDAEGWPLQRSGPLDTLTRDFQPGQYRLLVMPQGTDAGLALRLLPVPTAPALSGHGPHALPFAVPQTMTWREPAGRDDPRLPDLWRFSLAGPAQVTLSIGDGMAATLLHDAQMVGRFSGGVDFHALLAAGRYTVQATSQGRNDRLDYRLSLRTAELQPDVPRIVRLPSQVGFALAQDGVASLTSFGGVAVHAVLRDAEGHVLGRFWPRPGDWNLAVSRRMPPGRYTLDLSAATPPAGAAVPHNANDVAAASEPSEDDDTPDPQQQSATLPPGDGDDADAAADDAPEDGSFPPAQTEVTLSLPAERPTVPAPDGEIALSGGGVQHFALPVLPRGHLLLARAASSMALILAVERQDGGGLWQVVGSDQGLAPVVAVPGDGTPAEWRLSVWPIDGGVLPMRLGARLLDLPAGPVPAFTPSGLGDLGVAHVALPTPTALTLSEQMWVADWPGHPAAMASGLITPQGRDLWLVASHPAQPLLAPVPPGQGVALTLSAGRTAMLPAPRGDITAWIGRAVQGQPGLDAGHGMGVAAGSSLALATTAPLRLWNAAGAEDLRVTLAPRPLVLAGARALDGVLSETLAPGTALPLALPDGTDGVQLDLAPGTAAIAGWRGAGAVTVWTGSAPVSRSLGVDGPDLLLVNTGTAAAPVRVTPTGAGDAALSPDRALKRFFGVAGSRDLPVAAVAGQHLLVAGDATATFIGADGQVQRGTDLTLHGPGRVILTHGAGLMAAWLEGQGAVPWPMPAARTVSLPQRLDLSGPAMRLALSPATPVLLQVRSTAPVILALGGAPHLYPAGAALNRYLSGPGELQVISPHDGPLSGTLSLTATPVRQAVEGLGEAVALAPGDAALFGFSLASATRIGVGVQAEPDRVTVRLLDQAGRPIARGVAMLRDLRPGSYVLEVQVPPDAPATLVRPAIVGLTPRPHGPPADVALHYMELVGLTPEGNGP